MALSDKNKRAYSAEEIAILEGVIDYADRMIYEDQNLDALGGFRRRRRAPRQTALDAMDDGGEPEEGKGQEEIIVGRIRNTRALGV